MKNTSIQKPQISSRTQIKSQPKRQQAPPCRWDTPSDGMINSDGNSYHSPTSETVLLQELSACLKKMTSDYLCRNQKNTTVFVHGVSSGQTSATKWAGREHIKYVASPSLTKNYVTDFEKDWYRPIIFRPFAKYSVPDNPVFRHLPQQRD